MIQLPSLPKLIEITRCSHNLTESIEISNFKSSKSHRTDCKFNLSHLLCFSDLFMTSCVANANSQRFCTAIWVQKSRVPRYAGYLHWTKRGPLQHISCFNQPFQTVMKLGCRDLPEGSLSIDVPNPYIYK